LEGLVQKNQGSGVWEESEFGFEKYFQIFLKNWRGYQSLGVFYGGQIF
jgi:hypothetical protein